ncbi:AcrR family transcriptional regulator [Rhodococcus sp. 27YEA15]|uniref:TetR/AcrR family transcriptional regulator n=1 Tax=Rhodococcus sp. 27YEA15 TaxID=3156259 RepID=UPI003C7A998A
MPRNADDTRRKLQQSALDLFTENGYERTTATDIAAAAGVTERTFFRHFADKRDVLFTPRTEFEKPFLDAVDAAPNNDPRSLIEAAAVAGAASFAGKQRAWSRARQLLLDSQARLRERELTKLADLSTSLTTAFIGRGVDPGTAAIAAEIATTAFRLAHGKWTELDDDRSVIDVQYQVLADLDRTLTRPTH